MRFFTLKRQMLFAMFVVFGCLAIHAVDDELITKQITVKLDEAGTLPDKIGSSKKYKLPACMMVGEINGTDLNLIRDMAGCDCWGTSTKGKLAILDLVEAKIVEGGYSYYYLVDNYNGTYTSYNTSNDCLGAYVFYGCIGLTSLSIPFGVTSIGFCAFGRCSGLTNLTIPSSVTSIGWSAFEGCSGLTSLTIPSSVTSIGGSAFAGCSGLTFIYVYPEKTPRLGTDIFFGCDAKKCKVYVPTGTYDDYWLSEFGYFENIEEFDATDIDNVTTASDANEVSRYSVNGQRLSAPSKGLNIVKYSDGSVKKVVVQ